MIVNQMPRDVLSREKADELRRRTGAEIVDVESLLDLGERLDEVTAIIPRWRLKAEDLDLLPNLRWIQSFSAGVNTYPLAEIAKRGILLTNTRGTHAPQMSDQIMGMVLAFSRPLMECIRHQKERRWQVDYPLEELTEKTLLIVGAGSIGQLLAKKAKAFDMRVVGLKRHPEALPDYDEVRPLDQLEVSLGEADYVVLLAPLTPSTRGMLGEKELRLLKPTAVLINAARGPLVEEAALLRALQEKWFRGAGLDVFSKEPLPEDSPLWDLENLILTPHIGGFSDRHTDRTVDFLVRNIHHFQQGESLENLVNLEEGY